MGAGIGAGIGGTIGAIVGAIAGAGLEPYRESIEGIDAWRERYPGYEDASDQEVLQAMYGASHTAMGIGATLGTLVGAIIGAKLGEPKAPPDASALASQGGSEQTPAPTTGGM